MARNINAAGGDVYRAVITITDRDGVQNTRHEGPYAKEGAARGRVTFWTNYFADYDDETGEPTGTSRATGHVERAVTTWHRLDGETPPQHLAKGTNAEDCPACHGTNPPYPFLCPGPTEEPTP